jgi:hypothetical protein
MTEKHRLLLVSFRVCWHPESFSDLLRSSLCSSKRESTETHAQRRSFGIMSKSAMYRILGMAPVSYLALPYSSYLVALCRNC